MHKKEFIIEAIADDKDYGFVGEMIWQLPMWNLLMERKGELVRCKDCKHFDGDTWCFLFEHGIQENDFCSRAERKEE